MSFLGMTDRIDAILNGMDYEGILKRVGKLVERKLKMRDCLDSKNVSVL